MPRASTTTSPSWRITTRAAAIRARRWNIACVLSSSATDRGSYAEAVAQFETGLELLQKLPDDDRRAELELDLRNAASYGTADDQGLRLARSRAVVRARNGALPSGPGSTGKRPGRHSLESFSST